MKTLQILWTVLIMSLFCPAALGAAEDEAGNNGAEQPADGQILMTGTPALMNLASDWATAYNRLHPSVKITLEEAVEGDSDLSGDKLLITHKGSSSFDESTVWSMVIGRDGIVAIMNGNNPLRAVIERQGINAGDFRKMLTGTETIGWNTLLKVENDLPVTIYRIDNAEMDEALANYVNAGTSLLQGIMVKNADELKAAIQKNPQAIGFCRMSDICQSDCSEFAEGIALLPIDKNSNGRLDSFEQIYNDPENFIHGLWVGKYPAPLCRNIYALAQNKPAGKEEIEFLTWVMNDGQALLSANGYTALQISRSRENIAALSGAMLTAESNEEEAAIPLWLSMIIGIIISGAIIIILSVLSSRKKKYEPEPRYITDKVTFLGDKVKAPAGLYYDKTHTWAFMEKNGIVRVGLDDFMQRITGPVSRFKMKESGDSVRKGELLFTLISEGKQLNMYSPVSGIIADLNKNLNKNATLANSSPYGDGWIYTLIPTNWIRETEFMFMYQTYEKWLKNEYGRLRDFFAGFKSPGQQELVPAVLQDGGEVVDNVLADLDPKVWEEFQTRFVDASR